MSKYARYDTLSKNYDQARSAFNTDLYLGAFLTRQAKPLGELRVLDAGCGTGNYGLAVLEAGVRHVTFLDASEGMLGMAKEKTKHISDTRVKYIQHSLPTLPFEEESFDVVMFNNVLHHLDPNGFSELRRAVEEAYRVLRKDGILVI